MALFSYFFLLVLGIYEETDKKQILGSEIDSYRVALTNSLSTYLNESFKPNKTNFCVYGSDNGQLTIVISAKNINLSNYWTGSWRGIYSLSVESKGIYRN